MKKKAILVAGMVGFWLLSGSLFAQSFYLLVGTYTGPEGGDGIHVYRFDSQTGQLTPVSHAQQLVNPSYLAIAPNGRFVYACTGSRIPNGGGVSSFRFDPRSGQLTFVNKQDSGGDNPVYVSVHSSGQWLINANYTGASLSAFRIHQDGSLAPASQVISYADSTITNQRDNKSHIHSAVFSPDEQYAFFPDLGADKIRSFAFDPMQSHPLRILPAVSCVEGSGPRHFTFHPNRKFAYCIEELSGTVTAYRYAQGRLDSIQRIATHPSGAPAPYASADIHLSPDGKFLYASNRASEHTLTVFRVHPKTGRLTLVEITPTYGKHPRNFMIDPTGRYVLVGNMDSNTIVVLKRNAKTGRLTQTNVEISVKAPACLKMLPVHH